MSNVNSIDMRYAMKIEWPSRHYIMPILNMCPNHRISKVFVKSVFVHKKRLSQIRWMLRCLRAI